MGMNPHPGRDPTSRNGAVFTMKKWRLKQATDGISQGLWPILTQKNRGQSLNHAWGWKGWKWKWDIKSLLAEFAAANFDGSLQKSEMDRSKVITGRRIGLTRQKNNRPTQNFDNSGMVKCSTRIGGILSNTHPHATSQPCSSKSLSQAWKWH